VHITKAVGTMWAAYLFVLIALVSFPQALHAFMTGDTYVGIAWLSQSFLQLVLLPIIIVGQNVISASQDARAEADPLTLIALHARRPQRVADGGVRADSADRPVPDLGHGPRARVRPPPLRLARRVPSRAGRLSGSLLRLSIDPGAARVRRFRARAGLGAGADRPRERQRRRLRRPGDHVALRALRIVPVKGGGGGGAGREI